MRINQATTPLRAENAFARIAAAAFPFLYHDEAQLALFSPERQQVDCLLTTRGYDWDVTRESSRWMAEDAEGSSFGIAPERGGFRSYLKTPVFLDSAIIGVLVFFSRSCDQYGQADLMRAEWVADIVSSLAREGRLPLPANVGAGESHESFAEAEAVLEEIGQVLDVRDVFPRISQIVQRVLPHDHLTMTFHAADGHIDFQAGATGELRPTHGLQVDPEVLARPFVLLPELSAEALANYKPEGARRFLLGSGFGSFLAVNLSAGSQRIGVEFWAKEKEGFGVADISVARRVARYIALAVAHKQLVEAAQRSADALSQERSLEHRVRNLSHELNTSSDHRRRMVGCSPGWTPVLRAAALVAETDSTVLLIGESGSGKEVVARFIHAASNRRRGPFIAVNCAALPENLLESELFGHERGAFTGATHAKPGQIELATGGILFLDEVSEMSMSAQAKFLRVLQEREYRRLGGTRMLQADIRLMAATNVDLQEAIRAGRFRKDLYYRLRVFDLRIPPLRERVEDIVPLSDLLLEEIAERIGRKPATLTRAARATLAAYRWPGNVRELRNILERASIVCDGGVIDVPNLSFDTEDDEQLEQQTDIGTVERDLIERVLDECGGNKTRAAKRLGLSRMQLYVRLKRYQLDQPAN